jgi:hypothetical protein
MDRELLRRLASMIDRVAHNQQELLEMVLLIAQEHGRTPQETVVWEETLALAADIKVQVGRLRAGLAEAMRHQDYGGG